MIRFVKIFLLLLISLQTAAQQDSIYTTMDTCVQDEEQVLQNMINEYRKSKNLKSIPLSKQLTIVAKLHARDLHFNRPFESDNSSNADACNLHSWSAEGLWDACCYSAGHKNPGCMWDKPAELSEYSGTGYEIVFGYERSDGALKNNVMAREAMRGWKSSGSHNPIIINKNEWSQVEWQAMGIAVFRDFAVVWFGRETDVTGPPEICR